jgi:protocatechuate 3,4-dioxygenase beta subunit
VKKELSMLNDDRPVGRVLSRRQLMALMGSTAGAAAAHRIASAQTAAPGTTSPNCIAIPQQTEGPYFVDERLVRSDIRQDPSTGKTVAGVALDLQLVVTSLAAGNSCTPLAGALVDIWQCDAMGIYSDVRDRSFDTTGQRFLRGQQLSGPDGVVRFRTIYPGWYPGRAVHVHFKIRTQPDGTTPAGEFISQFYFDEALTDRVHAREPYAAHKGQRLRNERDMIYREGGAQLLLPVTEAAQGMTATFNIAIGPGSQPFREPFGPGRRGSDGPRGPRG